MERRRFLWTAALPGGAAAVPIGAWQKPRLVPPPSDPVEAAGEEGYWRGVASHDRVTDKIINLEAGYWGLMSGSRTWTVAAALKALAG